MHTDKYVLYTWNHRSFKGLLIYKFHQHNEILKNAKL